MKVYVLCTVSAGLNTLELLRREISIAGVIGLGKRAATDSISGYVYMGDYCSSKRLEFIPVQNYSLKSDADQDLLRTLDIDVLLVLGWQRLIPGWLISRCSIGAIGVHGSAHGISAGRGRSPQNWALMLGATSFAISIFHLDEGVDSGDVIDTREFPLTVFDDIRSSYYKASWLTAEMLIDNLRKGKFERRRVVSAGPVRYLPQRTPEDGAIDWGQQKSEVFNFVRALTRPYPGAFSALPDCKITVWRVRPFDLYGEVNGEFVSGEIVLRYNNDDLLVKVADGFMLIDDYSVTPESGKELLHDGRVLPSISFQDQIKNIAGRHYRRYPDFKIHEDVLDRLS